jgi:hypothetical protein
MIMMHHGAADLGHRMKDDAIQNRVPETFGETQGSGLLSG